MKNSSTLYFMTGFAALLLTGCLTPPKVETALTTTTGHAIVFGKVGVLVGGEPVTLSPSEFSSHLFLEMREEGSATVMEHAVDETGYFFWTLAPGDYEILGTRGYADRGFWKDAAPLVQRVWVPFTVPRGVESLYVGELTLRFTEDGRAGQALNDNYPRAVEEFRVRYPNARTEPQSSVAALEPDDPGTWDRLSWICDPEWGLDCSSDVHGVAPTSPVGPSDVSVESTMPTLRWTPSPAPEVTYDVVVFEAYDSVLDKVVGEVVMGKKHWRPGRRIAYAQALDVPAYSLVTSLRPGATYLWSVRLRRDGTVSTWSHTSRARFPLPVTVLSGLSTGYFPFGNVEALFEFATPGG